MPLMTQDGWDASAKAWIAGIQEGGASLWGRKFVTDPAILARLDGRSFNHALDVGCGEGRFCRMLASRGIVTTGIDPTKALLEEARRRDAAGDYCEGNAEALAFADASFDLVVSYLTLIDIPDFRAAIAEMARVLTPGGTLLVANLQSYVTPNTQGWIEDANGALLHWPLDRYLSEAPIWVEWAGIRVVNWHRPLSAYMQAFLGAGLQLVHFDEPGVTGEGGANAERHRRVPWFLVMEWRKPDAA
jgi:SAM-dependent methyltransferase